VRSVRHHVNLSDPRNRGYKDFRAFHEEATSCPANAEVLWLNHGLHPDVTRIVVTARMRRWETPTTWFLLLNDVHFEHLFMRRDGDTRPDYEVKRGILDHIESRYRVVLAVDDNPNVLRLWRERGIRTIEVPGWE